MKIKDLLEYDPHNLHDIGALRPGETLFTPGEQAGIQHQIDQVAYYQRYHPEVFPVYGKNSDGTSYSRARRPDDPPPNQPGAPLDPAHNSRSLIKDFTPEEMLQFEREGPPHQGGTPGPVTSPPPAQIAHLLPQSQNRPISAPQLAGQQPPQQSQAQPRLLTPAAWWSGTSVAAQPIQQASQPKPAPQPAVQPAPGSPPGSPTGNLVPGGALDLSKLTAQVPAQPLQSPEPPPMTEWAMTWEDLLVLQEGKY